MRKHAGQHHKTEVRHPRPAPRHPAKAIAVKKAAAAKAAPVAVMSIPGPRVIEVMELEFVDPDIMLDEEAAVTSFDDEDF